MREINPTEHEIQCAVIEWFDYQYRQYTGRLFAVPNGGHRHIAVAKKMKSEGQRKGVPDLFLPVPLNGYHGLFIEMKSRKGKPTPTQKDWINFLIEQSYRVEVCNSVADAVNVIGEYLSHA